MLGQETAADLTGWSGPARARSCRRPGLFQTNRATPRPPSSRLAARVQ